mgnify:FL=1
MVSMFRIDLDAVSAMIFLRKAYLCQFDRVKIEHITIILRLYSLKSHKKTLNDRFLRYKILKNNGNNATFFSIWGIINNISQSVIDALHREILRPQSY